MADDDQPKEKEEALDLLAGNKKPSRRERQRLEAAKNKTIDDKKAEALDLGVEDEEAAKPNLIRKTEKSGKDVLPSISKKLEGQHDPEFVKTEAPAADEGGDEDDGATVEGNVISIKPPIIVSTLAEKMGLKPFEVMADLVALEVFVALNQAIEPDIAEQVCEKHGFVFEREKREKGGGVHKAEEVVAEPEPEEDEPEEKLALRAPIITSCPSAANLVARAWPTIPVPRTETFMADLLSVCVWL